MSSSRCSITKDFFHKSPCLPLRSYNYLGTISNIFIFLSGFSEKAFLM